MVIKLPWAVERYSVALDKIQDVNFSNQEAYHYLHTKKKVIENMQQSAAAALHMQVAPPLALQ